MERVYISAEVTDKLRLIALRDELYEFIDAPLYYRKVSPHITIIPQVIVEEGHKQEIREVAQTLSDRDIGVELISLGVWKNISNPYIILLDIRMDVDKLRNEIINELDKYTINTILNMRKPHITLMKTKGWPDKVPREITESIQYEIMNRNINFNTEIRKINVEFRG